MYTRPYVRAPALLLLLPVLAISCLPDRPQQPVSSVVHGVLYAEARDPAMPNGMRKLAVPGVNVYLKGASTPARTTTSRSGVFSLQNVTPGTYQLCWEAEGYVPDCAGDRKLTVTAGTPLAVPPATISAKAPVLSGRVTLANNAPCSFDAPGLGVSAETIVHLVDSGGRDLTRPVAANAAGEFLIPDVPPDAQRVRAECDGMQAEATVSQNADQPPLRVVIENTGPRILSVTAGGDARPIHQAPPGTTLPVSVTVRGAENGKLHYRWQPSDADGQFTSEDSPTIRWTLPSSVGLHTISVLVTDEAGGHSAGRVDIQTGPPGVMFSGTVSDKDGSLLADAEVDVNGQRTTTNGVGYFFVELPEPRDRYVLNIDKRGYQLISRVLFGELVGAKFTLVQSTAATIEPGQAIDLVDSPAKRTGAEVHIEANGLADRDGLAPGGALIATISTIDLQDEVGRLPGNFGGTNASGQHVRLTSFGAVDVSFADAYGNPYNLVPGKPARVRIPAQRATALPASAPFWFYDRTSGLWTEGGTAFLSGGYYEASVTHFSAINVALAATDAACMRLTYDPGTVTFPFDLHITIPNAAGGDVAITSTVSSSATDVIAELPPNEPITLQIGTVELSRQVVSSGAGLPGPANPNPPPVSCNSQANLMVAPTDALGFDSTNLLFSPGGFLNYFGLDDQVSADAYYAAIDPVTAAGAGTITGSGASIVGIGTSFSTFFVPGDIIRAVGGEARTIAAITDNEHLTTFTAGGVVPPPIPAGTAYERVGVKTTLDKWKVANAFTSDDAAAVYFNAGDLGFGRSMHMHKNGSNIAFYVSNYPNVEAARLGTGLIATVAMDYSPNPLGGAAYTKFYVFNAAGARINNADLDLRGAKFIPRLCNVCHAGQYVAPTSVNHGNMGSRFIAFDLKSYEYSGFDPAFSRAGQEEMFRRLNQGVLQSTNPSTAAQELINGWYAHGGGTINTVNQTQLDTFVPTGWTGHNALYLDVVRPACRTCHVNRDHPIDWAKYSGAELFADPQNAGFQQYGPVIEPFVCGIRFMPHAKVTYIQFWSDPARVSALRNAGLNEFSPSLPCPVP